MRVSDALQLGYQLSDVHDFLQVATPWLCNLADDRGVDAENRRRPGARVSKVLVRQHDAVADGGCTWRGDDPTPGAEGGLGVVLDLGDKRHLANLGRLDVAAFALQPGRAELVAHLAQ